MQSMYSTLSINSFLLEISGLNIHLFIKRLHICAYSHVWCVAGVTLLDLLKLKDVMLIILLCLWNLSPIYSSHTGQIIQFSENKNDTQMINTENT